MDIDQLAKVIKGEFDKINQRFDSVDKRFDSVEQRLSALEKEMVDVKQEVHEMRKGFSHELRQLRDDIESLEHVTGYAKEIDLTISRVNILEQDMAEVKKKVA